MSYLSSPLWLMLLLVGFALTLQATLIRPEYFSRSFQLFPDWPQFDAPRMTALFIFTMVVLFTPKILGLLRTICFVARAPRLRRRHRQSAPAPCVETILSALYAPIMMLVQTQHVIEILTGRDSGWNAQRRHAHMTTWREAWSFHWPHLVIGIVIGVIAFLHLADAARVAHADTRRPAARGAAVEDQRQRQARPLPRLVPRAAHTGRETRACGDPATRRVAGARASMPTDGLRYIARNRQARYAHITGNLPRPQETRGHPDPHRLTAERKLADARTLNEVLAWLGPAERVHVAGDARLLERLAELPDN